MYCVDRCDRREKERRDRDAETARERRDRETEREVVRGWGTGQGGS